MEGEESKAWRAELSSFIRGVERALRALGRLSVTVLRGGELDMLFWL